MNRQRPTDPLRLITEQMDRDFDHRLKMLAAALVGFFLAGCILYACDSDAQAPVLYDPDGQALLRTRVNEIRFEDGTTLASYESFDCWVPEWIVKDIP